MNDFTKAIILVAEAGGYTPEEVLDNLEAAYKQVKEAYSKTQPPYLDVVCPKEDGTS